MVTFHYVFTMFVYISMFLMLYIYMSAVEQLISAIIKICKWYVTVSYD